jgi:hypothetical protein
MSGIEGFATASFLGRRITAQDVANRMWGEIKPLVSQVDSQAVATIVSFLPGSHHLLLDLRRCLARTVMRSARLVAQTVLAQLSTAPHPLPHDVTGGVP